MEFRLVTKVENGMPTEKWVKGFFIDTEDIIDALKALSDFNKLSPITINILAKMFKTDIAYIEKLCKHHGITYFTEPPLKKEFLCPKCQSSAVLHYPGSYKCQSCGHIWMKD